MRGANIGFREAEALAENVSVGQALTYAAGAAGPMQTPGGLIEQQYGQQPWLNGETFDIRDEKQRAELFTQHLQGQLGSGLLDLIVDPLAFIPVGKTTSATRVAARLQRTEIPAERLTQYQQEAIRYVQEVQQAVPFASTSRATDTDIQQQLANFRPTTGFGVRIHQLLTETNPTRLLNNPIVNEPGLAPVAAALRTPQEAAVFALAMLGDTQAARTLDALAPSVARGSPIPLPPPTADDIIRVFDDLLQRNPTLNETVTRLANRAATGSTGATRGYTVNPQPLVERFRIRREGIITERLTGGNVEGIAELMVGRRLRYLAWPAAWSVSRLRPLGYASLNNPRPLELADEVAAFFGQSKVLRQMQNGSEADQQIVRNLYTTTQAQLATAPTENLRAQVIRNAEQEAATIIAQKVAQSVGSEVDRQIILDNITRLQQKRDSILDEARTTGVVLGREGEESIRVNPDLQTKLVSSLPMLDPNVLERSIRKVIGQNTATGVVSESLAGLFENFNVAFSAAVLIRPGYIPKNSIFEPAFRTFLTTNTLPFQLLPMALRHMSMNSASRIRGVSYILGGLNPATRRVRAEQLDQVQTELEEITKLWNNTVDEINKLERSIARRESRLELLQGEDYIPDAERVDVLDARVERQQTTLDRRAEKLDQQQARLDRLIAEGKSQASIERATIARDRTQEQVNEARQRLTQTENSLAELIDPEFGVERLTGVIAEKTEQANRLYETLEKYRPELKSAQADVSRVGLASPEAMASAALRVRASWETATETSPTFFTYRGPESDWLNVWNMPGGRADLAEVSPIRSAASLVTSPTTERVRRRQRESRATGVPVAKGSKQWWDAYATTLDTYRVNDPVFSRIIQGENDDSILNFLMRDLQFNGTESTMYRLAVKHEIDKQNSIMMVRPVLDELDESFARRIIDEARTQFDELVPDDLIRQRLAAGPVTRTQLQKAWEARGVNYVELLPALPRTPVGLNNANMWEALVNVYATAVDTGFRLITQPEYVMFRSPFMKRVSEQTMVELLDNARRSNVDITQEVLTRYAQISRRTAVAAADETFYAVRRMNNAQYMSRFLLGFPNAMYNSIRFYAQQAIDNPYTLVLLNDVREAPYDIGMVVDEDNNPLTPREADRQNKETYVVLPFPLQTNTPGFRGKLNTRQFDFLTAGPTPSWLATVPLSLAVTRFPTLEQTLSDTLGKRMYGTLLFAGQPQFKAGESASEMLNNYVQGNVVPRWLTEGLQLAYATADKDKVLGTRGGQLGRIANTVWAVHSARLHSYAVNNPDQVQPADGQKFLNESLEIALSFERTRWVTRLLSPLGVTWEPSSQIVKDYRINREAFYRQNPDMLGNRDIDDAVFADMITMWGGDEQSLTGFLVSSRTSDLGVQPTQVAYQRLQANRDLVAGVLKENPSPEAADSIGIITDTVIPGEFSPAVYSSLDALEVGGIEFPPLTRSVRDREQERLERNGWLEYNRITARYDSLLLGRRSKSLLSVENRDLWASRKQEVLALAAANKPWGDKFGNSTATIAPNLRMIGAAVGDDTFMRAQTGPDKQKWDGIAEWYELYVATKDAYDRLPPNSAKRNGLREWWEGETARLRAGNTFFADFHSRYLQGDEVIDVPELLNQDLPPVGVQRTAPQLTSPAGDEAVDFFNSRAG